MSLARRPPRSWLRAPGVGLTLLLLSALAAVNGFAVWGIVAAREAAEQAARQELELETEAQARSLESVLAGLRGDLVFVSQAPPLVRHVDERLVEDPQVRRWGRLEAEGTALLFMQSHPAVEEMTVAAANGEPLLRVGRRDGAPVVLPPAGGGPPASSADRFVSRWPLGPEEQATGEVVVTVRPAALLAVAAPGFGDRLRLDTGAGPGAPAVAGEVRVEVADAGWSPPVAWRLSRSQEPSELLRSVESLSGRYRAILLLNLAVIAGSAVLGFVALRQVRRTVRLQAAQEHQTRVRELERRLMHSERLAGVGRLAAGIAHEINNPLEGMSNYLRLLEEDIEAGRTDEAPQLVSRVREGLERAAGVVRQVLAFSDPGRTPKQRLDLTEVAAGAARFVASNPMFRGLEVRTPPASAPLWVDGNATTLGQVFLNLLLNACESQPDGGLVELSWSREGEVAVVTVADRGPGLDPEVAGRLFEPFVSTRGSTGLGLAVCHGIVREHGGSIRGGDRAGGGARFEVRLPLAGGEA